MIVAIDSGISIAAEKNRNVQELLKAMLAGDASFLIAAPVVAEVIRGGPGDGVANRLIKVMGRVLPTTEAIARDAGRRIGRLKDVTIDALIVATAEAHGATDILTTNVSDISRLASDQINILTIP